MTIQFFLENIRREKTITWTYFSQLFRAHFFLLYTTPPISTIFHTSYNVREISFGVSWYQTLEGISLLTYKKPLKAKISRSAIISRQVSLYSSQLWSRRKGKISSGVYNRSSFEDCNVHENKVKIKCQTRSTAKWERGKKQHKK